MRRNHLRISVISALSLAFILAVNTPSFSASTNDEFSVSMEMLAKNKQPVPTIDAPIKNAPHPPGAIHGSISVPSDVMLAKNKKPVGTVDAPIKNAPHPPGAIHGSISVPSDVMLAKNKKPVGTVDAPIKNAPHPPGAIHG